MRVTTEISFTYDPETEEISSISVKPIKKEADKIKPELNEDEPTVHLLDNKLCLSLKAAELIGAVPGDRLSIKFQKSGLRYIPVIGLDSVFDCKGGNKLTKSLTLSCRGKQNEELVKYGTKYVLEKKDNICIMRGDAPDYIVQDENIKDTEDELSLDDMNLEDEPESKEISLNIQL